MPFDNTAHNTSHEVQFLEQLADQGKVDIIKDYLTTMPKRHNWGNIDKYKVKAECYRLLGYI